LKNGRGAASSGSDTAAGMGETMTIECPVCLLPVDGTAETTACPNCKSDLGPIRRIRELSERYVNEALALAGRGEYDQALSALMSALQLGGESGRARLLLGKIHYHQGRCEQALVQWRHALAAEPDSEEVKSLIRAAERRLRGRRLRTWAAAVSLPALLAVAVVLALLSAASSRRQNQGYAKEVAALRQQVQQLTAPPARPASGLGDLAEDLRKGQALQVTETPDEIRVVFKEGLFASGSDELEAEARDRLRALGEALTRSKRACRVEVEGFTDNVPLRATARWRDSWSLGLARAIAVTDHLRRQPRGPGIRWVTTSSGDQDTPFPNDGPGRARNRTVVLHISPAAAPTSTPISN